MTIWNTKDKPREPVMMEVVDDLPLTPEATVTIDYEPFKSAILFLSMTSKAYKQIDVNDREGTRRMVLRELLPMAEAALVALRQAVAEFDPPTFTRADGQTRPAVVEIPEGPDAPIDIVGFTNDLMRGAK